MLGGAALAQASPAWGKSIFKVHVFLYAVKSTTVASGALVLMDAMDERNRVTIFIYLEGDKPLNITIHSLIEF